MLEYEDYPELESCSHLLEEICDYAIENLVPQELVQLAVCDAYWSHDTDYSALRENAGRDYEEQLHTLNVHVLEDHVRPKVKEYAGVGLPPNAKRFLLAERMRREC